MKFLELFSHVSTLMSDGISHDDLKPITEMLQNLRAYTSNEALKALIDKFTPIIVDACTNSVENATQEQYTDQFTLGDIKQLIALAKLHYDQAVEVSAKNQDAWMGKDTPFQGEILSLPMMFVALRCYQLFKEIEDLKELQTICEALMDLALMPHNIFPMFYGNYNEYIGDNARSAIQKSTFGVDPSNEHSSEGATPAWKLYLMGAILSSMSPQEIWPAKPEDALPHSDYIEFGSAVFGRKIPTAYQYIKAYDTLLVAFSALILDNIIKSTPDSTPSSLFEKTRHFIQNFSALLEKTGSDFFREYHALYRDHLEKKLEVLELCVDGKQEFESTDNPHLDARKYLHEYDLVPFLPTLLDPDDEGKLLSRLFRVAGYGALTPVPDGFCDTWHFDRVPPLLENMAIYQIKSVTDSLKAMHFAAEGTPLASSVLHGILGYHFIAYARKQGLTTEDMGEPSVFHTFQAEFRTDYPRLSDEMATATVFLDFKRELSSKDAEVDSTL